MQLASGEARSVSSWPKTLIDLMESKHGTIWDSMWCELEVAVADRRHPWHTAIVATCDGTNFPRLRTVVLRAVDPSLPELRCHTDLRSSKCCEVAANPATSWLLYSPETKIQLRLSGLSTIHHGDDCALAAWQKTNLSSRRCYLSRFAPGDLLPAAENHLPDDLIERNPDFLRSEQGWEHFAVLSTEITSVDWLQLDASGHNRMQFQLGESGVWTALTVAP
jgi:pyridoxamine 5'-phosphate oxidase